MEDDKLVAVSMEIILNAGDARMKSTEALKALEHFDFDDADAKMKEAFDKIRIAHTAQTNAIQDETRGIKQEHSLLFTHAQDTLMTIYSALNITKRLIAIMRAMDGRISKLEER